MSARASVRGPRLLPLLTAGLLSSCAVIAVVLATTLLYALLPAARGNLPAAALTESAVYLGFALFLARAARAPRLYSWLTGRRSSVAFALLGVGLGVALHGPAEFLEAAMDHWYPLSEQQLLERVQRLSAHDTWGRVQNLLAVAVLVPCAEEVFFRGALWSALRATAGPRAALSATSVFFALSHLEARSWPALALVAAALGALRQLSSSLWPPILLHATFNATTLLVIFSSPTNTAARGPSWPFFLIGSALSGLLLLQALRLARPPAGVSS